MRDFHNEDSLSCSCERCKGLPRPQDSHRIQDLEAQCAAMRNCLEALNRLGGLGYDKHTWIEAALATDAGKAFEQRIREDERAAVLRIAAESAKRDVAPMVDRIARKAAESMRERAAKVAEGRDYGRRMPVLRDIAAAIRALPLEET